MRKRLGIIALTILILAGCSSTQCLVAKKGMETAKIGYKAACESGIIEDINKYKWMVNAAEAIVIMQCGSVD